MTRIGTRCGRPLEPIFQPKLHLPIVHQCGSDSPEGRITERSVRRRELRRIEKIERLVPELQGMTFSYLEFLKDSDIPGLLSRGVKRRDAGIAIAQWSNKCAVTRTAVALGLHERSRIEPFAESAAVHDGIHFLAVNNVGPLRTGSTCVL